MLSELILQKALRIEKYLIAFCILLGMQTTLYAQYNWLNVPAGTDMIREGIVHVTPGDDITLTVPFTTPGTPVKWEYRFKRNEPRTLLATETSETLVVSDIQHDAEYFATVLSFGMPLSYRILISCATIYTSTTAACPNQSIKLSIKGGEFADNGKYERKEGPGWRVFQKSEFSYTTYKNEWIVNSEKEFTARATFDYGYYSTDVRHYNTNEVSVVIRNDCKAECLTTTTGDYYVGTDFDPKNTDGPYYKMPDHVEQHFGDYDITFTETPEFQPRIENQTEGGYWLGTNTQDFFGQTPALDANLPSGSNYYVFCQDPNANIVSLKFKGSDVWGKSYQYKMRLYLQMDHECKKSAEEAWANAKFIPRTTHGKASKDYVRATAYDNENNQIHAPVVKDNQSSEGWIVFGDILDFSKIQKNTLVRIEIEFFGTFPNNSSYKEFTFTPRFEQFECGKVALDYISAEIENVCLRPQILCAGEYTTAHAAGFPMDAVYRWYRKEGESWIEDVSNYGRQNASFQAQKGMVEYELRVTSSDFSGVKTKQFTVSGNDCEINRPSEIVGGTFCFSNVEPTTVKKYSPNVVDGSKDLFFEWTMYKPDNTVWFDSKTSNDPHFQVLTSSEYKEDPSSDLYNPNKHDVLQMSLSLADTAVVEEGDYKLELRVMKNSPAVVDTVMDTIVHIYRNPDITLKLLGDKFEGAISESDKTICPSDRRREIIAQATNNFNSPYLPNYVYSWNSVPGTPGVFTPDPTDPTKARVDLSAIPDICSGDYDKVAFSVTASLDLCVSRDENEYKLDALGDISIDCNSLIGISDTIEVAPKRDDVDITNNNFPIPNFMSGCDTDPKIIIDITPKRAEVSLPSNVSHIEVFKSEILTSVALNFTLPWGEYDFHYTLEDGCGRQKDCHANIVIQVGKPAIDCSQIDDIDVVNGQYNSLGSDKCTVVFNSVDLKAPVLIDYNDVEENEITGVYQGRRHFSFAEGRQNKDDLMQNSVARALFDKVNVGLYDEYEIDYTYILWSFTNEAGKTSYCVQEVLVEDKTLPSFDCAQIESPFRPITEEGVCEIKFEDFWDILKNKNYIAYDSCPVVTPIPGELHSDPLSPSMIEGQRVFKVGIEETVYWQFRDKNNNVKTCPQIINAFSGDSVDVDCDALKYFEATAEPGTCFVNASKVNFPRPPYGVEPCLDKNDDQIKVLGVGIRNDGKNLEDDYPTGDTYITWTFTGENSFPSTCKTHVFVKGNKEPEIDCNRLFPKRFIDMPDCDPMDVELFPQRVADPCVAGYMMESVPYIVNGTDSTKLNLTHTFEIGETLVTWMFWDYTHNMPASCIQSIHLRDTIAPDVNCSAINDSRVVLNNKCEIPFDDLRDSLGNKFATEHCTGLSIAGVPYLLNDKGERTEFPSSISVGIYNIQWYFANDSLTTKYSTCDKKLEVLHDGEPIFDCKKLESPLQLFDEVGLCEVELNPSLLPIPVAYDSCKRDYPIYGHGYIQLYEKGDWYELCYFDTNTNKEVYLKLPTDVPGVPASGNIPLGGHMVKWEFKSPLSVKTKICEQQVKVNNDVIKRINCEDLASTVNIVLMTQGAGASYAQVVAAGLILPNIYDPCNVLKHTYTRDDGKNITDEYPLGTTHITWLFEDMTENAYLSKECHTTVIVTDGAPYDVDCPDLNSIYTCLEELPAPYATLEEFKAAGGKIMSNGVDVSQYAKPESFRCDTMSLGDKCDYTFRRTYYIENQRGQVSTCKQEVRIKDDEAPVWTNIDPNRVPDYNNEIVFTNQTKCDLDNSFFRDDLEAKDECSNEKISTYRKVSSFDGVVDGLFYKESSDRSLDPRDCNYYNYTVTQKFVAVDRCKNKSSVLVYNAKVVNNDPPQLNISAKWLNDTIVAEYGVPCVFKVPDLTNSLPDGSFYDSCDPDAYKYFTITQSPKAGTLFDPDLGDQYVTIYITDPCGKTSSVQHKVYVPKRKDVISDTMYSKTICAEDELLLNSKALTKDTGSVYTYNKYTRKWEWRSTDKVVFDYYRGNVSRDNIIFSNNPRTYGHLFDDRDSKDSLILDDVSKTGLYSIVVMDTVRLCTDTASAYITVHGKPVITLRDSILNVCEGDSLHLISDEVSLFDMYDVYIDDNGEIVEDTAQGWMLNGTLYEPQTLISYTDGYMRLQYWATNVCGTGVSSDWISVGTRQRMNPENLMLTTEPNNPPRVYYGESAKLNIVTKYEPEAYMWYRVKGTVDGISDEMFDKYGNVREEYKDSKFEQDTLLGITYFGEERSKERKLEDLGDSAQYYVLMIDSVCPAVPSNIVAIDVVKKLPTAFTPHNSIGMNDVFMEGHKVIIFNRYGLKMVESDNGWDGTCRGALVDPGVYFYEVIINNGEKHKGSIEVVYFK